MHKAFHDRLRFMSRVRQNHGEEDAMAALVQWEQIVFADQDMEAIQQRRNDTTEHDETTDVSMKDPSYTGSTFGHLRKMSFMNRLLGKNRRSAG